jgi:hypothetical protein
MMARGGGGECRKNKSFVKTSKLLQHVKNLFDLLKVTFTSSITDFLQ